MDVNSNHLSESALYDHRLVQQAVGSGDQSAYAELMQRHRDAVYFMFLKKSNNPIEAEDLTIEVFSKAFLKLDRYSPRYAFSTWLGTIATNHYIDFLRRKKEAMSFVDQDAANYREASGVFQSEAPDPEEYLIKNEKVLMLRQVVEKLKPHYCKLIELRYYRGYSIEEIASELDLPAGTVKAKLFRAREFLYNILKAAKIKI